MLEQTEGPLPGATVPGGRPAFLRVLAPGQEVPNSVAYFGITSRGQNTDCPWPPAVPQTHQIQSCLTVCPIYMDTFFVSLKSLLISYQFMRGTLALESSPALHFFSLLCSMFHLLTCSIVHTFIIAVMYTIPSSPSLCHSLPPPYVSFFPFS